MSVLPRGKTVKENVNPIGMDWLDVLEKLHDGHFSGYLQCVSEAGTGRIVFVRGKVVLVCFEGAGAKLFGAEALARFFAESLTGRSRLGIFRLAPELAIQVFGLLTGEVIYAGQHRELLDIPHLLALLKQQHFDGGLHIEADDQTAVIFYHAGLPLGFFLDGSPELTEEADPTASVAWQPGARINVIRSRREDSGELPDLMAEIDLMMLWQQALTEAG
jgi:hypothetical protein